MRVIGEMKQQTVETGAAFDIKSSERRGFLCEITPEDAQWLIDNAHPNNRNSPAPRVDFHVRRMLSGTFFQPSEPGIYVDKAGRVCNGLHRLRAQVKAGVTLQWSVVLGASDEEILCLDNVRSRAAHQSVNLATKAGRMTHREEAVIRQYLRLEESESKLKQYNRTLDPRDLLAARDLYGDDIAWGLEAIPKSVGTAPIAAAIAYCRAVDCDAMSAFAETYRNARLARPGSYEPGAPALALAQFMINQGRGRAGGAYTDVVMLKTLSACKAALQGRTLQKLQVAEDAIAWIKSHRHSGVTLFSRSKALGGAGR
jgi:hypothetical protein